MRMRRQNHGNRKSRKRRCYLRKIQAIHGFMQQDSPEAARPIYAQLYVLGLFQLVDLVKYKVWRNLFHELQK